MRHRQIATAALAGATAVLVLAPVAGPTATRPASHQSGPDAAVTYYGAPGSFGAVAGLGTLPGGQSVATQGVASWGFPAGQANQGAALGPDGSVVMGDEPQTGDQALATATTMGLSVFSPATAAFSNVAVPTTTGVTSVTQPGWAVGGADVSAMAVVPGHGSDVAFMSAWPYRGWAVGDGLFPSFGYVTPGPGGAYQYDTSSGRTAAQIGASGPYPDACPVQPSGFGVDGLADCRGPASMGVLPASGDIAVAQYYDNPAAGLTSGALMVLSPSGSMLGWLPYPDVSENGVPLDAFPREIDVDPTSPAGAERFVVVFDVFTTDGNGGMQQGAFTMQEFSFDGATGAITPLSAPIVPGQTVKGRAAYFETARFDRQGDLFAAESVLGAISGGDIVEYSAASVASRLSTGSCAAGPTWPTTQWALACPPDRSFAVAAGAGDVTSIDADPGTGDLYFANLSGALLRIAPGLTGAWRVGDWVDLGLNELLDRSRYRINFRQGALDPSAEVLWLPVEQTQSAASCAPLLLPCQSTPPTLDQWLVRVNLKRLS